jgi:UDPglucose 6-dehydrogenase
MRVAVIGTGYVGLVSGACFADFGHTVVCVDTDAAKIGALQQGAIPIFEPGLDDLVARNVKAGRLLFTTALQDAMNGAAVVFIAVGTPTRRGDGHADLSYVYTAAEQIAAHLPAGSFTVVVTKSTVPVGTGDAVEAILHGQAPASAVAVVSNPEFLREGAAINDFKHPDRIVVGTDNDDARRVMAALYRPLHLNQGPLLFTGRRTAELIKYAANAFLAMKITFINEMADLCEQVGANVQEVARGIGLDNRIGRTFLHAGPGYGGSCFPKDTLALVKTAADAGSPLRLIETTVAVNNDRKQGLAARVVEGCGGSVSGKTIAVLGLTFKPNTDDMRDAPSLTLVPMLQAQGATVRAFDPEGMLHAAVLLPDVILTEWDAFRALDLRRIKERLKHPVVIDFRNIYSVDDMQGLGFTYRSIGRP